MKKLFTLLLILSPVLFFCWSMPGAKAADRKEGLAKERAIDSYKVIRVHSYGGISPKVLNIKPGPGLATRWTGAPGSSSGTSVANPGLVLQPEIPARHQNSSRRLMSP